MACLSHFVFKVLLLPSLLFSPVTILAVDFLDHQDHPIARYNLRIPIGNHNYQVRYLTFEQGSSFQELSASISQRRQELGLTPMIPIDQQNDFFEAYPWQFANSCIVSAPLPARVIRSHVQIDDEVTEGDPLCVLECMKMEIIIRASRSGRIKTIFFEVDHDVELNSPLISIVDWENIDSLQIAQHQEMLSQFFPWQIMNPIVDVDPSSYPKISIPMDIIEENSVQNESAFSPAETTVPIEPQAYVEPSMPIEISRLMEILPPIIPTPFADITPKDQSYPTADLSLEPTMTDHGEIADDSQWITVDKVLANSHHLYFYDPTILLSNFRAIDNLSVKKHGRYIASNFHVAGKQPSSLHTLNPTTKHELFKQSTIMSDNEQQQSPQHRSKIFKDVLLSPLPNEILDSLNDYKTRHNQVSELSLPPSIKSEIRNLPTFSFWFGFKWFCGFMFLCQLLVLLKTTCQYLWKVSALYVLKYVTYMQYIQPLDSIYHPAQNMNRYLYLKRA